MSVANGRHNADFSHASERVGGNVGTVWLVTQVFGEQLFATIRSRKARLDRYLRNGESP